MNIPRGSSIEAYYTEEPNTGCWLWIGGLSRGYARITRTEQGQKRSMYVTRMFYEREHGPIPEGLTVDHRCRMPSCVNPRHLQLLTRAENTRRGSLKPVCGVCGEPWRRQSNGKQYCGPCNNRRQRTYYREKH